MGFVWIHDQRIGSIGFCDQQGQRPSLGLGIPR